MLLSAPLMGEINTIIQGAVAILVITDPITRGLFFRQMTASEPERRPEFVRRIAVVVAITLFGAALIGKELLDLMGIDLGAFGIAGGLVVALMGFEMLLGGEPSRAQGGKGKPEEVESFEGSLIVPWSIPFVAGPGAITTVITIATQGSGSTGLVAALVGVGLSVLLLPVGYLFIANRINPSPEAEQVMTKVGGLIIATIGIQLILNGAVRFFGLS